MSPATGRPYPLTMICEAFGVARSSVYASQRRQAGTRPLSAKRGPKPSQADAVVLAGIREILGTSPFHGEGYRKVQARLRAHGLRVGRNRVLRLMRQAGLLAPVRRLHAHGPRAHNGTIITDRPDRLWGTDATRFYTEQDGWCWFFGAIDHCVEDLVGWHVAKIGDRYAALEPILQGVRAHFGALRADVARGLAMRHDWGPQYTSNTFQGELCYLGIQSSPAFVGEPQGNGIAERFMRTLKEQCLYVHQFRSLEDAREKIRAFIERYNQAWLLERLGYRTPLQARADYALLRAA